MQQVSVSITPDLEYYVNDKRTAYSNLENVLASELAGQESVVVLHIDKSVPVEHLVKVADIATRLKAKVSIATKPE